MSEAKRLAPPASVKPALHFIDGEFRAAHDGRTFPTLNPTTNDPITEVAEGTAEDVEAAVRAAGRAFDEGWSRSPARERARWMERIADAIEEHGDELVALECLDVGLPVTQASAQTVRAADNFRFFAREITQDATRAYRVEDQFINYTIRKPVGVAGLITPWNTPFMLETWKVAPCLATGNTAVLKPAEWAPLSAHKLAEIVAEVGLPPGVLNVVNGIGEVAGAALVAHPGVRLISFTGETTTGREITRSGASSVKRYSLELGGKSPVVVFDDADLGRALDGAIFGVFTLNGERCTAGSRILVQEGVYERFVDALGSRAEAIRVGDPFDPATELGPLIRPEHWDRVKGFVDAGVEDGARLVTGGDRPPDHTNGNFLQATVFADVGAEARIFQEEIFGPVVACTPFRDEDEAVRLGNDVRYGLTGYVWTADVRRGHRVAQALEAGMVWINSQNVRDLRTPFGGVKASGLGREGGRDSLDFYCEPQIVHVATAELPVPRLGAAGPT
jgi:5-carboxymethyl-2-hydroxymuconic-semialdehyde dehydrogenase